jgi:uncharacterized protein (TIRG00374 family)
MSVQGTQGGHAGPSRFLPSVVGSAISLLALAIVLRWAGWRPMLVAIRDLDARFIVLAALVFLVSMWARAACWHTLLGGSVPMLRVLATLNEGYLLNNVLPWRLGEVGRAILLGRRPGLSVPRVLSTILIERLYDLIFGFSILLSLLPTALNADWARPAGFFGGAFGLTGLAALWVLRRNPAWIERLVTHLPGGRASWGRTWQSFHDGLQVLGDPRRFLVSLFWMASTWMLAGVEYWLVLRSVYPPARLSWAFFMLAVSLLGGAIPSSPGAFGVFEAAGVAALAVFGVPAAPALAASLLIHGMVYAIGSLFGAIALAGEGESLASLVRQARAWLSSAPAGDAG